MTTKPYTIKRRSPDHVALLMRLTRQYPEAFRVTKPGRNTQEGRYTKGGSLIKTAAALEQRQLVLRELMLAGIDKPCVAAEMTDFDEGLAIREYRRWRELEAK